MDKVRILHLGIKNFPFKAAFSDNNVKGFRGGGVNKYCSLLIDSLPAPVESVVVAQKLKGDRSYEYVNNVHVYRLRTLGPRVFSQIVVNIYSFFFSFKLINKYGIQLIHGHMLYGILVSFFLGRLFKLSVVGTPYSFITKEGNLIINITGKAIEAFFYKRINKIIFEKGLFTENKYLPEVIKKLSKNYKIAVLSNSAKGMEMVFSTSKYHKYFTGFFWSHNERVRKPDERFYKLVEKKYKVKPPEILFFDDKLRNTSAAEKIGWKAIKFTEKIYDNESEFLKELEKFGIKI